MRSSFAILLFAASAMGCSSRSEQADAGLPSAKAVGSGAPAASSSEERLRRIEGAEQRRAPGDISADDWTCRDPNVRRAAARALARIATPAARASLLRALSDEDPDVIAWAAYGLGATCDAAREETVSALVARALDLPDAEAAAPKGASLDPFTAIARAVGRCGAATSEPTLAAWLGSSKPRAAIAALALGDLVGVKKRLREETIATLLTLAAGSASSPAVPEALFPIARAENVPPSVVTRLLDVASARLADKSDFRLFAIRALAHAKGGALPHLERVLLGDKSFTGPERVEAVRAIARLGLDGQQSLVNALRKLSPEAKVAAAGGDPFDVALTILGSLKSVNDAKDTLTALAALTPPDGASAAGRRRVVTLRCGAAKLLADANFKDPLLVACDLDKGPIGSRALVEVVGKGSLQGARLDAFGKLVSDPDVKTREAALELLSGHAEVPDPAKIVLAALGAKESGVVATAADQIAKAPRLASQKDEPKKKKKASARDPGAKDDAVSNPEETSGPPSVEVVKALKAALDRADREHDPELLGSVVDALGALAIKDVSPKLEELCASTYPVVREHAAGALGLLTGSKRACPAPATAGPEPPELALVSASPPLIRQTTLVLDTDEGELRIALDLSLAPVAVARFVDLAKAGYYDGNVIHRVDPSFVVQFGSPHGDGFGGPPDRLPLRCETSPLPFETLSVGVALAGRDTGSSQLFVMRARHPHLDGGYAIVGKASGPWDLVSEGDVIQRVRVE